MNQNYGIPKVFLSHSSLDKEFINKIFETMKKSQINPWLDTEEIRAGSPWMNVIFNEGIPKCDTVLVYFTENALGSKMVSKEVDTSLIQQMNDNKVNFLPFVETEAVRKKLRPDIQTLHCPILNKENYTEVIPTIIAEVWRSYFEKKVPSIIAEEKAKRLEAEIKLKDFNNTEKEFSKKEEDYFEYITKKLREPTVVNYLTRNNYCTENTENVTPTRPNISFEVIPLEILTTYLNSESEFSLYQYENHICKTIGSIYTPPYYLNYDNGLLLTQLKTYGLVGTITIHDGEHSGLKEYFNDRLYKYRYWLEVNKLLPKVLSFKEVESLYSLPDTSNVFPKEESNSSRSAEDDLPF